MCGAKYLSIWLDLMHLIISNVKLRTYVFSAKFGQREI